MKLSEASLSDVSVEYQTLADGVGASDGDFSGLSGVLTIPAGQTSGLISIRHRSGSRDQGDQNFTLVLTDPVNGVLAGGESNLTATGTILDNDGSNADRGLFVSDPTLIETDSGTKQAVFEARISEPSPAPITLEFSTQDGTAVAGEDYVGQSGFVTFLPGQTITTVTVDVLGDTDIETQEQFSLVVIPNAGIASGVDDSAGVATILDDDSDSTLPVLSVTSLPGFETEEGQFILTLSEPSLSDVSVTYRPIADGSAFANYDFSTQSFVATIPAGQTSVVVNIRHFTDSVDQNDQNYTLQLSSPSNAVLAGGGGDADRHWHHS